nr:MAG TPA: hypothetical protein [Caudoviricetes sp.]
MFWGHFAIQYHVLRVTCTVFQCFACDIIRLRKPQGAGQHPTPCGFCIARLRQGNTLPTNSLNVPAGQFLFWYPWRC